MAKAKQTVRKYKVIPRTDSAAKEPFILVNGKPIKMDIPVALTDNDVKVLKSMKEPMATKSTIDVNQIMDEMRIPRAQAEKIAQARAAQPDMQTRLRFVPRFEVIALS